ncbi:hypothetical protein [Devosia sp. 2618]|uniref:hypothetical protein n=1 Tax=Devosia sp. 2618 TaxID=3156454 RepID=UPI0033916DDE
MLPAYGAVLGVDVGGSLTRRSTAVCRLSWTPSAVSWTIERCTAEPVQRRTSIERVVAGQALLAAAFDGPLARGFEAISRYRPAERMLTRGLGRHIGKPGQSNTPVGRALNEQANACAGAVLSLGVLAEARHTEAIDRFAVAEAFPSAYLGLLLGDPAAVPAVRSNRSDQYFAALAGHGTLSAIVRRFLPGRELATGPVAITNHDDRAAFVCALTALGLAGGDYCAVGDPYDGWIILPPMSLIAPWAQGLLAANVEPGLPGAFVVRNQGADAGL